MSDFEPLTPSKVAALANAVQTLYQQPINDNISLTGTTAATTNTYLDFGYNVITTATATNYACRLPNPPIKGRSTVIVNNSGFPIVIYPSVTGGSINGVVNGSALIPADGKPYTFFCYENPLPGGWTWTPPAINQYDSGEISLGATLPAGKTIYAINSSTWAKGSNNSISMYGLSSIDGINLPLLQIDTSNPASIRLSFKPSPKWNQMTKIKVYTNLLADGLNPSKYGLYASRCTNYYDSLTGELLGYSDARADSVTNISTAELDQTVSGTPVGTNVSANIGDPGTLWGEQDISSFDPIVNHGAGDNFLGTEPLYGVTVNTWFTRYLQFGIGITNNVANVKFRFFIEYN
jgi:hypothetical protein